MTPRHTIALALIATASCHARGDAVPPTDDSTKVVRPTDATPPPEPPMAPRAEPVTASTASGLSWSLARSPDQSKLLVDIAVTNTTAQPIYVAAKLVTSAPGNTFARSDRLTVMNTDDPAVAKLVLGAVSSNRPAYRLYEPTYEPVAPGATVRRHVELALPLTSWNPVGGTNPLSPATRSARLIVYGFAGEPTAWTTLPSHDAEPLRIPELDRAPLIFEAPPLPLP